jgi:catechol 2,3-dioxygenase-like lactoylglutathione lyase family enzyme
MQALMMRVSGARPAVAAATLFAGLLTLGTDAARAQLAAPGAGGVAMGHLHLGTKDADASRKFWTAMGGVPVQNGALQLIQVPGTFIMLRQTQQLGGGTEGSTIERVSFRVRSLEFVSTMAQAAELKTPSPLITSPEGVAIELRGGRPEDPLIRLDVVLFRSTAPVEMRDWYVKTFGAEPETGSPGISGAGATTVPRALLPGVSLSFGKAETAPAGTRGRALDHIGFEVKNLEAFCKKLEASGQKFDRPYGKLPNSEIAIAFLTDPWGTYIELTENLAPPK